jgi:multidrug efflux pump
MRIWLDPEKVAARDLTAGDVIACDARAERAGLRRPSIGAPPQPDGADLQISINAQGRLSTEEFGDIVVKTGR